MNKTKVIFLLLSIFSLFLISCTATSAGNDDEDGPFEDAIREAAREKGLQLPLSEDDFEKLPLELQEFELTYELLDMSGCPEHHMSTHPQRAPLTCQSEGTAPGWGQRLGHIANLPCAGAEHTLPACSHLTGRETEAPEVPSLSTLCGLSHPH